MIFCCARRSGAARGEREGYIVAVTPQSDFFKREAKKRHVPYQRMIRRWLTHAARQRAAG
jgi:hypothetical protein